MRGSCTSFAIVDGFSGTDVQKDWGDKEKSCGSLVQCVTLVEV